MYRSQFTEISKAIRQELKASNLNSRFFVEKLILYISILNKTERVLTFSAPSKYAWSIDTNNCPIL